MAKASLNMMTRTAAPDYAQDMIFMTAVDTVRTQESMMVVLVVLVGAVLDVCSVSSPPLLPHHSSPIVSFHT
mgnify:CR=1 FL=1